MNSQSSAQAKGASATFQDTMGYTQEQSRFQISTLTNTTGDFGMLIPVYVGDLIPGDQVNISMEMVMRLAPMLRPSMHPINSKTFAFKVPLRIIWRMKYFGGFSDGWEQFITGGDTGDEAIPKPMAIDIIEAIETYYGGTLPSGMEIDLFGEQSLWDYMGLPIIGQDGITTLDHIKRLAKYICALPFMGYYFIWFDRIRDKDLDNDDINNWEKDTFNPVNFLLLRPILLEKDVITTARPWQLRGTPPAIPLGGYAPIKMFTNEQDIDAYMWANVSKRYRTTTISTPGPGTIDIDIGDGALYSDQMFGLASFDNLNTAFGVAMNIPQIDNETTPVGIFATPGNSQEIAHKNAYLKAALNEAVGAATTLASFRDVTNATHKLERSRGGNRYSELLDLNWGTDLPDHTAQRVIYVGGTSTPIIVSEVLKVGSETPEEPIGALKGKGIASQYQMIGSTYSEEHALLYVISVTTPVRITYQGINKFWDKRTLYDYHWPDFVNSSEAAIKRREVYCGIEDDLYLDDIYGYQENYYQWKTGENRLTGKMRTTLKNWQMPLTYTKGVNDNLAPSSIYWDGRDGDKKVIFAVPSEPSFQLSIGINLDVFRQLPFITIPGTETI